MKIRRVSAANNDHYKLLEQLLSGRGLKKSGSFLVSGEKVITEALRLHAAAARELIVPLPGHAPDDGRIRLEDQVPHTLKKLVFTSPAAEGERDFTLTGLAPELFETLDIFGTHFPLLVCDQPALTEWRETEPARGLEILCALQDPANLGALIRSCDAFGASRIVLLRECATPFHPKAVRAASGSTFRVSLAKGPSIQDLKGPLYALDMKGESLDKLTWPQNARLLLGEEGQGTPAGSAYRRISIPMRSGLDSLNATVAASLALYAYRLNFPLEV
jgi:RNA methyltransferase, TrmH family